MAATHTHESTGQVYSLGLPAELLVGALVGHPVTVIVFLMYSSSPVSATHWPELVPVLVETTPEKAEPEQSADPYIWKVHKSVVLVEQRLAQFIVTLCTVTEGILTVSVTVTGRQGVLCPLTGVAELVRVKLRYTLPAHVESELAYSLQLKVIEACVVPTRTIATKSARAR